MTMLKNHRLTEELISVGMALPFDTYDAQGKLLLRAGFVVDSEAQLERLLERGLYCTVEPSEWRARALGLSESSPSLAAQPKFNKLSVFGLIGQAQAQLEAVLAQPSATDFTVQIEGIARQIQRCFKLDGDATLAWIQVFEGGRYAVRRMMHGAILAELLLDHLGETQAQRQGVICAALTMNMAMMDLQDTLYSQATAPTPEQRTQVNEHPEKALAMLRALDVTDEAWLGIVVQHHETIDGKGYPHGLMAAQISRDAQLLSLADRYGAMATSRGYRPAALPNVVLKQIFMDKDKGVDAKLATLLVKTVGVYPPGSVVALANGEVAVVVKRTQVASQPVVRCVKTNRNQILEQPRKRLTSEPTYAITRLVPMSELGFTIQPDRLWDEGFEVEAKPDLK
jgi:hypothetical protein